jgi:hypothetical protein
MERGMGGVIRLLHWSLLVWLVTCLCRLGPLLLKAVEAWERSRYLVKGAVTGRGMMSVLSSAGSCLLRQAPLPQTAVEADLPLPELVHLRRWDRVLEDCFLVLPVQDLTHWDPLQLLLLWQF